MTRSLFKLNRLDPPLVLFVLSAVAGVYPAYDRSSSWPVLAALITGAFLYAAISRISVSQRRWRVVAVAIIALGVLLSLYFVTQYAHLGYDENLGPLSGLGALIGRIVPSLAIWTPHVNGVATFVEGVVFLAVGLTLTQKRWLWRLAGAASVGLMGLALLMAGSRGGWLAVVVAGLLWAGARWWPVRVIIAGGCIVALGLTLYVVVRGDIAFLGDVPVVGRLLSAVFLRPDRLDVYRGSVYLIQDFPLTGIGLGDQFAMVHSHYVLLIQHAFLTYSHNLYLEVWLEQGLVGIVALVWLIASLCQAVWTHKEARADLLFQSTWVGLTAIFVHGTTDARQYEDLWCWLPFFGLLGLGGSVLLQRDAGETRRRRWLLPVGVAAAFLILVAVALFPWSATYYANQGCVAQAQAALSPVLDDGQRTILQKRAIDHYRRAIQIEPGHRTARQRLGLMLIEQTRFGEGVEHLKVAWEADPRNTTTQKALGLAYVWVGELEEARPLLSGAPGIVEELNAWGWWRGTQKQMEQSLHAYRMSLLLEPDQPEVRERVEQLEAELNQ